MTQCVPLEEWRPFVWKPFITAPGTAARTLAESKCAVKPPICLRCYMKMSPGVNQRVQGTFVNNMLNGLHLITGQICRPGGDAAFDDGAMPRLRRRA
jgi:hypothetical protein